MVDTVNIFSDLVSDQGSIDLVAADLPIAAEPTFSVATDTGDPTRDVTITTTATGATIYYTTDGTDPTSASSKIAPVSSAVVPSGTVSLSSSVTTIKAFSAVTQYMDSAVVTSGEITVSGAETGITYTEPGIISGISISRDTTDTTLFTASYTETGDEAKTIRWYLDTYSITDDLGDSTCLDDTDDDDSVTIPALTLGRNQLVVRITKGDRVYSGTLRFTEE
jgi:hypothetical protein